MAYTAPITRTTGDIITASIWNQDIKANEEALALTGFTTAIDGGGAAITTGTKHTIEVPFAMTLSSVTATADVSGSIVVDLWKDTYANYPPTNADSICSSSPITIATATKSQDTSLTGWTKAWSQGDIILPNVDSCTTITKVSLSFKGTM